MVTDDSVGLLLEQPREAAPLSAPPCSERGVRNNMIQLRLAKYKAYYYRGTRKYGFRICTEEVWGYCMLTNEINAGDYLYLPRNIKGNLGSVCLVADWQAKHADKREASSARQVQGVIDWLISHPTARAFEGVSGGEMRRSQQRGQSVCCC